jgi:hypothetical protein
MKQKTYIPTTSEEPNLLAGVCVCVCSLA